LIGVGRRHYFSAFPTGYQIFDIQWGNCFSATTWVSKGKLGKDGFTTFQFGQGFANEPFCDLQGIVFGVDADDLEMTIGSLVIDLSEEGSELSEFFVSEVTHDHECSRLVHDFSLVFKDIQAISAISTASSTG
jgi:hypothetical protein